MNEVISTVHINPNAVVAIMLGVCLLNIAVAWVWPFAKETESK